MPDDNNVNAVMTKLLRKAIPLVSRFVGGNEPYFLHHNHHRFTDYVRSQAPKLANGVALANNTTTDDSFNRTPIDFFFDDTYRAAAAYQTIVTASSTLLIAPQSITSSDIETKTRLTQKCSAAGALALFVLLGNATRPKTCLDTCNGGACMKCTLLDKKELQTSALELIWFVGMEQHDEMHKSLRILRSELCRKCS